MALVITHAKTNDVADWTQADLDAQIALGNFAPGTLLADIFLPSDWNDDHSLAGSIAWGEITGTLSSQSDLQTALDAKVTGNTAISDADKAAAEAKAKLAEVEKALDQAKGKLRAFVE